jgi:hypothetical protein
VPTAGSFRTGRDFAAWLGLTPLQKSTGGKQKLGVISKRGERTIRRLLILGQRGDPAGLSARGAGRVLAGSNAAPQAEDAGHRRLGQQDGSRHLGSVGQRRRLQSSGHGSVS